MQSHKKVLFINASVLLIAGLSGCASSDLIGVHQGSEQVSQVDASQVGNCLHKGEINVSVLAKIGFFTRSAEAVEADLLQLARNGAVDSGGDTVVKGNSPDYGKRTFAIYKCRQ